METAKQVVTRVVERMISQGGEVIVGMPADDVCVRCDVRRWNHTPDGCGSHDFKS